MDLPQETSNHDTSECERSLWIKLLIWLWNYYAVWRNSHGNLLEADGWWTTAKTTLFKFLRYILSNWCAPGSTVGIGGLRGKLAIKLPWCHATDVLANVGPGEPVLCASIVVSSWDILTFHSRNKPLEGPLEQHWVLPAGQPHPWWLGLLQHATPSLDWLTWQYLDPPPGSTWCCPQGSSPTTRISALLMLTPFPGREQLVFSAHKPITWALRLRRASIWHSPCMATGECAWK